jgi:hypothetical protein
MIQHTYIALCYRSVAYSSDPVRSHSTAADRVKYGAWRETWLCPGGQSTAVNSANRYPVNDLQPAARFGGTAPSCALPAAGAASGEPREVRMIGIARGEIEQSSHGPGSSPDRRPEGHTAC